ncbi:MAG TPA: serine/threonine-protein kinase, partial [Kofleriaceae bacterium]|nr:serine/threonine-protein kinase [Kofleriaceae bacterium]
MVLARLGPYELLTCLATGGMAEIYAARSTDDPTRMVIVKRMLPQYSQNPTFVEMFLDEGRTVSLLDHPNVVRMFYFGFEGETPYLAMEYLHGVDVRTILRTTMHEQRKVPTALAISIAAAVCAGLHHAHEAKSLDGRPMEIIHRDVSPQNVFVTFDGTVKLIDFGIAKARGRTHETRAGALKGKVPYMAPEQIRNATMDRRTDVYAVGVMLYELLTYRRPYVIDDGQEPQGEFGLMMAIVGHQIARPRDLCPELPELLEKIVLRALAARPADRYQTAEAMQRDLERTACALEIESTPEDLAEFLRHGFGEQAQPWHEFMRAGGHDVVTRIEAVGRLRGRDDSDGGDDRDDPTFVYAS